MGWPPDALATGASACPTEPVAPEMRAFWSFCNFATCVQRGAFVPIERIGQFQYSLGLDKYLLLKKAVLCSDELASAIIGCKQDLANLASRQHYAGA